MEPTQPPRRSETAGLVHFGKEMLSALLMALVAIFYVIQAFRIPTGSMEKSLLIGDFLLGLKFMYGAPVIPFTYLKLPGIQDPKPGDVVIFKYPGADRKDYIKRCIAGPGQTIEVKGTTVLVDGKKVELPPDGQYLRDGRLLENITDFRPLRIPRKGDVLTPSQLPLREFHFCKNLIGQEHPRQKVVAEYQLFIDGEFVQAYRLPDDDWTHIRFKLDQIRAQARRQAADSLIAFSHHLYLDDTRITSYTVKYDNYFMMGDNRDNSLDSRFWGYVNRNFIKAKAFIVYFSLDKDVPLWLLPLKIRWNRIGMLIRSWDGSDDSGATGSLSIAQ